MQYYRLCSGGQLQGRFFSFETRQLYTSKLSFSEQRHVMWESVSPYDSQPAEDDIVDKEEMEILFNTGKVTLH
jgi:hypothetical protein